MKDRISVIIPTIIFFTLVSLSSCTPESCFDETDAFLEASFYSYTTGNAQVPDSLTAYGLGRDTSKIYSAVPGLRLARLPLQPYAASTTIVIIINGVADTLSFVHTSYPHLISRECGYTFHHDLESVSFTTNAIDSIWVRNIFVTTIDEENIRIFY